VGATQDSTSFTTVYNELKHNVRPISLKALTEELAVITLFQLFIISYYPFSHIYIYI